MVRAYRRAVRLNPATTTETEINLDNEEDEEEEDHGSCLYMDGKYFSDSTPYIFNGEDEEELQQHYVMCSSPVTGHSAPTNSPGPACRWAEGGCPSHQGQRQGQEDPPPSYEEIVTVKT